MLRTITLFGAIGGLIVSVPMVALMLLMPGEHGPPGGMIYGYTMMLLSLSMVFFGVKQYRDKVQGGVIKFVPALLLGLAISFVACLFYVAGWELSIHLTGLDFADGYARAMIASAAAKGESGEKLAKLVQEMNAFKANYAHPLYRIPMTFVEMAPVGVLVSIVTAGVLRNSRVLPAH